MASTSSKNTPGDYRAEQHINNEIGTYLTYVNSAPAVAYTNHFAGDGLLMGKNARSQMCHNYLDIESQLFGIGATNLVNPKPIQIPDLRPLQSLNVIDRLPVYLPEPLVVQKDQRPYHLN